MNKVLMTAVITIPMVLLLLHFMNNVVGEMQCYANCTVKPKADDLNALAAAGTWNK